MYTHTLDTRPLRLRTYPFSELFFLFAGAEGLKQAGKAERAGNPSGTGAHISCPPLELARTLQEEDGENEGEWEEGRGRDEGRGKMPGERRRGGGTPIRDRDKERREERGRRKEKDGTGLD